MSSVLSRTSFSAVSEDPEKKQIIKGLKRSRFYQTTEELDLRYPYKEQSVQYLQESIDRAETALSEATALPLVKILTATGTEKLVLPKVQIFLKKESGPDWKRWVDQDRLTSLIEICKLKQKYDWFSFNWKNNYSEQILEDPNSKRDKAWNKLRQVLDWDTSAFKYGDWEHARRLRSDACSSSSKRSKE
jgi:hypothetical protein